METITITTEYIKLQDLLKFAAAVETGGEAKLVIQEVRPERRSTGQRRGVHHAGQEDPARRRGGLQRADADGDV